MNRLVAYIAIVFIQFFRWIPFSVLYFKSNIIAFLLRVIISYRKKTVTNNLKRCFPQKTKKEHSLIIKKFYKNVADILLESFKGLFLSKKIFKKHFRIINPELLDKYFEEKQSVICLAAHYANWEWGVQAVDMQIKHQAISIYKKLNNPYLEKWFLKKRSRLGMQLFEMAQTKEAFAYAQENSSAIILAADQHPSNKYACILADFFGERIGFLHGPEAYVSKTKWPVVYFDIQRVKRSYYTLEVIPLSEKGENLEKGELTQRYANQIEKILRKKPEDWLWSHKRWKTDYSFRSDYLKS
jgi:KDO2-lipid IV(A) lauroyltransferase